MCIIIFIGGPFCGPRIIFWVVRWQCDANILFLFFKCKQFGCLLQALALFITSFCCSCSFQTEKMERNVTV